MRFCCVVVVLPLICVLAGCLVAHAAPRRGGGGNSDPRWKRNFSPPGMQNSGGSYNKGDLVERILNRLQERLLGKVDLSQTNTWHGNQSPKELDLQRYSDQEDEFIDDDDEVPNRPAIKRKCIGRFQPFSMPC
ncbi:uncharacterized protein [Asterias amurensis]|uniref:uncharacterized protein n=1 Tax=Asterias amurensis TaxID=7602 RepID=UPI003AB2552E